MFYKVSFHEAVYSMAGFLSGGPSMVCDMQEVFRALIEQFLIEYAPNLDPKTSLEQRGKRTFLTLKEEGKLIREINNLFDKRIAHARIKNYGDKSRIRTTFFFISLFRVIFLSF